MNLFCCFRLSIEADPSHILPSLESLLPNQLYFCLQFCPFQRVVYLACGKNANAPDPAAKAPAKGQAAPVSIAPEKFWLFDKLNFDESERRSLQVLLEQTRLWQQELAKFIAVYGEHLPEVEETKIDKDGRQQLTTAQKAERAFEERFRAILNDLETLFGKLFGENSRLATFIHEVMQSSPETKFSAMMFMDPNLQILPWESMNVLSGFKGRVGRDFSIHMLHHRSQLATTAPIVSAPSIKHIVDPFGEDNQTDNKPANSEIQERKNLKSFWSGLTKAIPSASKWAPLRDGQGILSAEDFVLGLEQSSAALPASAKNVNLVVHCFGRLGSTLLPSQIATMNLSRIQYLFCADGGHCETSFRRQNSTDVLKAPADLELESNISLCALLSLSGVSAISMTAWSIPINAQHRLLEQFWKNFTNGKKERLNAIVADAFEVEGANPVAVKKWIKGARIHVGVSNFTYTDA